MLYLSDWEPDKNMSEAGQTAITGKLMQSGLFPAGAINVQRRDVTRLSGGQGGRRLH